MSLAAVLEREFSNGTRRRGESYFARGAVHIVDASDTSVTAYVVGGERYQVRLETAEAGLSAICTCPHFEGGSLCKHIWATVLAADDRRLLAPARHASVALDWTAIDRAMREALEPEDDELPEADLFGSRLPPRGDWTPPHEAGSGTRRHRPVPPGSTPLAWRTVLDRMLQAVAVGDFASAGAGHGWPNDTLLYVLDAESSQRSGRLLIDLIWRHLKTDGTWGEPKTRRLPMSAVVAAPQADRRVLAMLAGSGPGSPWSGYGYAPSYVTGAELGSRYVVPPFMLEHLLPDLCATGRAVVGAGTLAQDAPALAWDPGPPWRFRLDVTPAAARDEYHVSGVLVRDDAQLPLDGCVLLEGGFALTRRSAIRFEHGGAFAWAMQLRLQSPLSVPAAALDDLLAAIFGVGSPEVRLPEGVEVRRVEAPPRPLLRVRTPGPHQYPHNVLHASLEFDYGGVVVSSGERRRSIFAAGERRVVVRDPPRSKRPASGCCHLGPGPRSGSLPA